MTHELYDDAADAQDAIAFRREVMSWLESRGLVDLSDDEWDGFTDVIEEHERGIESAAIAAYLSAAKSEPVAVRALEWRDHRGHTFPDTWTAKTPCGIYEIEERSASDSPAYVATGPLHVFIADKDSLGEAKAAAQADYESRIRSALASEPANG